MAKANTFPGRNVKLRVKTLGRILSVRNNSPDALLAPLRQVALDTYRKVNTSIARYVFGRRLNMHLSHAFQPLLRGREDTMKEFTSGPFQEKTIKGMRRREKGQTWAWSITSDVSDAALFPRSKSKSPSFSSGSILTSCRVESTHTGGHRFHPSGRGLY